MPFATAAPNLTFYKGIVARQGSHLHSIDREQRFDCKEEGLFVDLSMMIRWIVVFLVIFILLMFFVFSFFKKQTLKP